MPSSPSAAPVEQLRDNAKRLEAALSVGLANPTVKAVHELRAATRRVEAQLALLAMVPGLPSWKPTAEKLQRRLDKLRRIAGRVRDCDVQEKLLKDQDHAMRSAPEAATPLDKAQTKLRKKVAKNRQRRERKLLAAIEQQLPKLARDTEAVLACLKPAAEQQVPVNHLLGTIESHIERMLQSREHGEEHLHDLRKAAKRARYQCESLPGPQAAALAKRLEQLQDAGGSWHDLLDLATVCHEELGPEHPFSRVIEHCRDEHLDDFLADLEDFRSRHTHRQTSVAKRKPRQHAAGDLGRAAAKGRRRLRAK
ncbi:MAG TPA: CHAD domain-containing protein [Acidobacteriaceae bacterium]|nr:CHAD domain-containing protein [Acidobacteriaceae bacterium]